MSFHYFTKHKSSALSAQAEYANLNYFHNGDNTIKKVALRCDRGGYAMYPCMIIVVFYVDRSLIQNIRYNFVSVYHAYKSPNHHISYKMVFVYHVCIRMNHDIAYKFFYLFGVCKFPIHFLHWTHFLLFSHSEESSHTIQDDFFLSDFFFSWSTIRQNIKIQELNSLFCISNKKC